jgi:DNA polymerase-3 subunit gamma/tau
LGELLDQLIEYWRDLMIVNCTGEEIGDISVPSRHRDALVRQAKAVSLDTILAGLDVLGATKARLRGSNHGRVLMEMALVRLSRLDDLVSLAQLSQWLSPADGRATPNATGGQKVGSQGSQPLDRKTKEEQAAKIEDRGSKAEVTVSARTSDNGVPFNDQSESEISPLPNAKREITEASLEQIWQVVLGELGPMLAGNLRKAESVAISGPKTLVLSFPPRYNHERVYCQESTRMNRIQDTLRKVTGQDWNIRVEGGGEVGSDSNRQAATPEPGVSTYRRQRAEAGQQPLVKRALEKLGAQIVHVDDGFGVGRTESPEQLEIANIEET